MNQIDEDFAQLVATDPTHRGPVDVDALIRAGARSRRRCTAAVAGGAALAIIAVSAPFALFGGDGSPEGVPPASSDRSNPRPADPGTERQPRQSTGERHDVVCGLFACSVDGAFDGADDAARVVGEPMTMGSFEGHDEVVYAIRAQGQDTSTGRPAKDPVLVLNTGVDVGDRLLRSVWGLQPETDPARGPIPMYGGDEHTFPDGSPHYGVIGYVSGDAGDITVTVDGETRPVTEVSTEVMPGYTVFFDTGDWDDTWGDRAKVTYALGDGSTCTPADCSVVG